MDEYIKREALLKSNRWLALQDRDKAMAKAIIQGQPTADVEEVRHGEWDDCECSVCGEINPTLYLDEWEMKYRIKETPYCPNCGAKMDGKGEGE